MFQPLVFSFLFNFFFLFSLRSWSLQFVSTVQGSFVQIIAWQYNPFTRSDFVWETAKFKEGPGGWWFRPAHFNPFNLSKPLKELWGVFYWIPFDSSNFSIPETTNPPPKDDIHMEKNIFEKIGHHQINIYNIPFNTHCIISTPIHHWSPGSHQNGRFRRFWTSEGCLGVAFWLMMTDGRHLGPLRWRCFH